MTSASKTDYGWWRYRIFILTWLVYAGFYLCRKNLSVVMPILTEELGYTKLDFAWMITGYSIIYMLGQFANGALSDRFGPRLIVGIGLIVSIASNVAMGLAASTLLFFGLLSIANGYGQSTGWSGTVKNMSTWFSQDERGVVMAWWATCYAIGGAVATAFATYVATNETFLSELGWRRAFFAPAILLGVIAFLYIVFTRNKPSDAGLENFPDERPDRHEPESVPEEETTAEVWKEVLGSSALWTIGSMYFFLKMTRYAFLFWLPFYMVEELAYSPKEAGYTSTAYELVGFMGIVAAGYASDKLMGSRRFPVACIMLLGLAAACYIYPSLGSLGLWWNVAGIAFIGAMTFGPDALMTGAAAMDIGSQRAAGLASGFINGMGSVGQIFSPLVVAYVSESRFGWNGLFALLGVLSLIAAALMATKWNYGLVTPASDTDER
ncbi:MAG: MFS transporter [Candidatus Hydrogenedentes bacterium]|nr:MFS transporter [Candidatus Hydrogenedentota bacterium]